MVPVLSNAFMCLVSLGPVSPLCFRKIDFSLLKFKHVVTFFFWSMNLHILVLKVL